MAEVAWCLHYIMVDFLSPPFSKVPRFLCTSLKSPVSDTIDLVFASHCQVIPPPKFKNKINAAEKCFILFTALKFRQQQETMADY